MIVIHNPSINQLTPLNSEASFLVSIISPYIAGSSPKVPKVLGTSPDFPNVLPVPARFLRDVQELSHGLARNQCQTSASFLSLSDGKIGKPTNLCPGTNWCSYEQL